MCGARSAPVLSRRTIPLFVFVDGGDTGEAPFESEGRRDQTAGFCAAGRGTGPLTAVFGCAAAPLTPNTVTARPPGFDSTTKLRPSRRRLTTCASDPLNVLVTRPLRSTGTQQRKNLLDRTVLRFDGHGLGAAGDPGRC
jgi:hypothetical protein